LWFTVAVTVAITVDDLELGHLIPFIRIKLLRGSDQEPNLGLGRRYLFLRLRFEKHVERLVHSERELAILPPGSHPILHGAFHQGEGLGLFTSGVGVECFTDRPSPRIRIAQPVSSWIFFWVLPGITGRGRE